MFEGLDSIVRVKYFPSLFLGASFATSVGQRYALKVRLKGM